MVGPYAVLFLKGESDKARSSYANAISKTGATADEISPRKHCSRVGGQNNVERARNFGEHTRRLHSTRSWAKPSARAPFDRKCALPRDFKALLEYRAEKDRLLNAQEDGRLRIKKMDG